MLQKKKRADSNPFWPSAGHVCAAMALHGVRPRCPQELVVCKRGLGFLDNHAEQGNTITLDSCFALKTLECVAFATGWSSAYPRVAVQHTGGNGGYTGQTRLDTMEVRGRPPSIAKRARIGGG